MKAPVCRIKGNHPPGHLTTLPGCLHPQVTAFWQLAMPYREVMLEGGRASVRGLVALWESAAAVCSEGICSKCEKTPPKGS